MTDLAEKVYNGLRHTDGWLPATRFASQVGLKDARALRGKGGDPGLIEQCSREIFAATGYCIVRRMGKPRGVRLTNDAEEIRRCKTQYANFVWHAKRIPDEMEFYLKAMSNTQDFQLQLSLSGKVGSDGA